MGCQRREHLARHAPRSLTPRSAVDDHRGLGIDRRASSSKLGQRPRADRRCAAAAAWPVRAPGATAGRDRRGARPTPRARAISARLRRRHEGAAAGRQDAGPAGQQPRDHLAFAGAKERLAVARERSRRSLMLAARSISSSESRNGTPQQPRKRGAHGGLAGAHHADQHHRPVQPRPHHGPFRSLIAAPGSLAVRTFADLRPMPELSALNGVNSARMPYIIASARPRRWWQPMTDGGKTGRNTGQRQDMMCAFSRRSVFLIVVALRGPCRALLISAICASRSEVTHPVELNVGNTGRRRAAWLLRGAAGLRRRRRGRESRCRRSTGCRARSSAPGARPPSTPAPRQRAAGRQPGAPGTVTVTPPRRTAQPDARRACCRPASPVCRASSGGRRPTADLARDAARRTDRDAAGDRRLCCSRCCWPSSTRRAEPATGDGSLLLARIDRLLEIGALEPALALLELAGPAQPELFRRWFDIGLLTGRGGPRLRGAARTPAVSPTFPARIFCLARGGDWNAAELTLRLGAGAGL